MLKRRKTKRKTKPKRIIIISVVVASLIVFLVAFLGYQVAKGMKPAIVTPVNNENSCFGSGSTECSSSAREVMYYNVGRANFPNSEFGLIAGFIDQSLNRSEIPKDTLDAEYDALFSSSYFGGSTPLSFNFEFRKAIQMNAEMYSGPGGNGTFLIYPTEITMGTQGNLLIIFAQISYLYGSPYGNSTSRGANQLTVYFRAGGISFGFGEVSDMLPGPFGSDFAVSSNGQPEVTSEGLYIYGYQNFLLPNQTYYVGPVTYDNQYGEASYDASSSFATKRFYWAGSVILGSPFQPLMTRYLYAINMSEIRGSGSVNLKPQILFSLQTTTPFPTPIGTTGLRDFLTLIDNFPGHDINSPKDYSSYVLLNF